MDSRENKEKYLDCYDKKEYKFRTSKHKTIQLKQDPSVKSHTVNFVNKSKNAHVTIVCGKDKWVVKAQTSMKLTSTFGQWHCPEDCNWSSSSENDCNSDSHSEDEGDDCGGGDCPLPPCPPSNWLKGRDGRDGRDGKQGPAGPAGPTGLQGNNGMNGMNGNNGTDGKDGKDGKDGLSGPTFAFFAGNCENNFNLAVDSVLQIDNELGNTAGVLLEEVDDNKTGSQFVLLEGQWVVHYEAAFSTGASMKLVTYDNEQTEDVAFSEVGSNNSKKWIHGHAFLNVNEGGTKIRLVISKLGTDSPTSVIDPLSTGDNDVKGDVKISFQCYPKTLLTVAPAEPPPRKGNLATPCPIEIKTIKVDW